MSRQDLFLYGIAGYLVIFLNQHFNVPLKLLPFLLLLFAAYAYWPFWSSALVPQQGSGRQRPIKWVCFMTLGLGVILAIPSAGSPVSIRELVVTFVGPAALGACSGLVLRPDRAVPVLLKASVAALFILAVTDVLHYARDVALTGALSKTYTHRWFGDGYLFFLPFLLIMRDAATSFHRRCLLQAMLIVAYLLIAGVGSRGLWLATLAQLFFMRAMTGERHYLGDAALLTLMLVVGNLIFSPEVTSSAIERGLSDNQRIRGVWLPALELIREHLWWGHGFGQATWNSTYYAALPAHPEWTLRMSLGGPHNALLQILFYGGLLALIGYTASGVTVIWILSRTLDNPSYRAAAAAVLTSIVGFYVVRALFEDPRWEPLGVILLWTFILGRAQPQESVPRWPKQRV